MDKTLLGAFIGENRRAAALTQRELAARLHVTDKAVSKWERGLSYPDVTLLQPLAAALGLGVEELVACRRQTEKREEEPVRNLLTISGDSVRRERRRSRLLAGALVLAVLAGMVVLYCATHVSEVRRTSVLLKETVDGAGFLYVELWDEGHLLRLRCEEDVDFAAIQPKNELGYDLVYRLDCRWNRLTRRGIVRGVEDMELISLGDDRGSIGSSFGLDRSFDTGDALFGYQDVSCETVYAGFGPGGKDILYSYTFWESERPLLTVENCLTFTAADIDGDGAQELIVRTRWPEKPYTVYDRTEDGITEAWPDTVGPELEEALLTAWERQARLQA